MSTMSLTVKLPSPPSLTSLLWLFTFTTTSFLTTPSTSSTDTFIYSACSQLKYAPGSLYETNVNSLLTSLVNSAIFSSFNKFTISTSLSSSNSSKPQDTISGLFQCRGDVSNSDCAHCVANSVSQLGVLCSDSTGGALQLEGCFVKYDNTTFLGVEDRAVVFKQCGPSIIGGGGGYDSDELTQRDAVLAYLAGGGEFYRVGASGKVQGVAQCVGDLIASECQDCLIDAIGLLRGECETASWGDMFLAKCYARYSEGGDHSPPDSGKQYPEGGVYPQYFDNGFNNDDDGERTLAIVIGIIAGVCLLIVFLYLLRKLYKKRDCK